MDHQEAIRLSVVEKYLLNELSPLERDDYEEHFFGCQDCATDVRITAQFLDAARRELGRDRGEAPVVQRVRKSLLASLLESLWRPAFLALALGLLLIVVVYQNALVFQHLTRSLAQWRQPALLSAVSLIDANSRAGGHLSVSGSSSQPVLLSVDIPAQERFVSYICELTSAAGAVMWRVPVSSREARDTVSIEVPAGTLPSGDYTLVVKGLIAPLSSDSGMAARIDVARYPFALQVVDR
jgi:hypothetical protein